MSKISLKVIHSDWITSRINGGVIGIGGTWVKLPIEGKSLSLGLDAKNPRYNGGVETVAYQDNWTGATACSWENMQEFDTNLVAEYLWQHYLQDEVLPDIRILEKWAELRGVSPEKAVLHFWKKVQNVNYWKLDNLKKAISMAQLETRFVKRYGHFLGKEKLYHAGIKSFQRRTWEELGVFSLTYAKDGLLGEEIHGVFTPYLTTFKPIDAFANAMLKVKRIPI